MLARVFPLEELALLDEIGDTIIPATDTPGAKAVGIGAVHGDDGDRLL